MKIDFSELAGNLLAVVIVCLVLLLAKSLVEFIIVLLAIGLVCWVLGVLFDGKD